MADFILPTTEKNKFVLPTATTPTQFNLPNAPTKQFNLPLAGTSPYFGQIYQQEDIEDREFNGLVWKVLGDYMQRGNFMAANVADAILRKDNDLLGAAWRGLKGEDKRYFSDVLSGMGANNTTATVLGLVLDIGLDPATYIPFGAFLKAGSKTLKGTKAFKAASKAFDATSVGKKLLGTQNSLIKLFSPGEGAPKALYELKKYLGKEAKWEQVKAIKKIADWQKDIPKEVGDIMTRIRNKTLSPDQLTPKQLNAYKKVVGELNLLGKQGVDLKLISKEAFAKHMDDYAFGFYEGKTKLGNLSGLSGKAPFRQTRTWASNTEAYDYLSNFKKRIANSKSLNEAREIALEKSPSGWKLGTKGAIERLSLKELKSSAAKIVLPEMNLFKSTAIREVSQIREMYRIKFVDEAIKKFGREVPLASKLKEIPEGMSMYVPRSLVDDLIYKTEDDIGKALLAMDNAPNVQGELLKLSPELAKGIDDKLLKLGKDVPKKYLMNDEYAHYLNKLYEGFSPGSEEFQKLLTNFYDPIQMTWKGVVTAMRPTFHIRNFTSNLFLTWIGGIDATNIPIRHYQGTRMARGAKGFVKSKNLGKLGYSQLEELAQKTGAAGSGWMGADKPHEVWETLEAAFSKGKRPLKEVINPIQYGRAIGTAVEDASRRALFIDSIIKSNKSTLAEAGIEAAEKVAKFLFDYGELSTFERKTMKRIFPFYTWARKNVPLQFSQILEQPEKYARLQKFRTFAKGFGQETKEEKRFTPEWMQDMDFIKSPWKQNGKPLYFYSDLPIKDLDYLINKNTIRDLVSGLSPLIKIPLEATLNVKNFPYLGEPIYKPGKEWTYAPAWLAVLPEPIRKGLGLKKVYDRLSGKNIVKIHKKRLYMMESILPMTRDLNMFFPQKIELLEDKSFARILAYPTGAQWKILDVAQEQKNMMYEAQQLQREITMYFKETGEIPQDKKNRLDEIILLFSKK